MRKKQVKSPLTVPLSATERVLLKYCSSTVQSVSPILLVTPQKPWQFTLISSGIIHSKKHSNIRELEVLRLHNKMEIQTEAEHGNVLLKALLRIVDILIDMFFFCKQSTYCGHLLKHVTERYIHTTELKKS